MRKFLTAAVSAVLIAAIPGAAWAQQRSGETPRAQSSGKPQQQRQQPSPQPGASKQQQPSRQSGGSASRGQYGEWRSAWGKTPPAPPAHWIKKGDWYRHVRACQQRYRSYNARTDTYRAHSRRAVRCRL